MASEPENPPDTLHLLRSLHDGDRAALDELIERHLEWIQQRVHQRLGPDLRRFGDTGDFVQEAMVNVLENGPQFVINDEDHFRRLLARIVENSLRGKHRFMHQERRDVSREKALGGGTILSLDPPQQQIERPISLVDRGEQVEWVRLAVELLSEADREVITLRDMEGLGFPEIGERLDAAEDAVRMRYNRALPRLAHKVCELKRGGIHRLLEES